MLDRLPKVALGAMREASEKNLKEGKPQYGKVTVSVSHDGSYQMIADYLNVYGGEGSGGTIRSYQLQKSRSDRPEAGVRHLTKEPENRPRTGDTVKLKSGGPVMTVGNRSLRGDFPCVFWCPERSRFVRDSFPPEVLKPATAPRYEV